MLLSYTRGKACHVVDAAGLGCGSNRRRRVGVVRDGCFIITAVVVMVLLLYGNGGFGNVIVSAGGAFVGSQKIFEEVIFFHLPMDGIDSGRGRLRRRLVIVIVIHHDVRVL